MEKPSKLRRHLWVAFFFFYLVWLVLAMCDGEDGVRTRAPRSAALVVDIFIIGYLFGTRRDEES